MKDDIAFLKKKIDNLIEENMQLTSKVAFLTGKLEAYEWFLRRQGFIKGDKE